MATSAALARDVRHEPDVALFGGAEGLRDIAGVLEAAAAALVPGGWLVMEFGFGQELKSKCSSGRQAALRIDRDARRSAGDPANRYHSTPMSDCLFCKIIAGEIPGALVHQDEALVAFKDINPQAPLHVLIVPRRHIATLNDLTPDDDGLVGSMFRTAAALAKQHGYHERGYRTVFNTQPRGRADGVSHPPAPARRSRSDLAAGIEPRARASGRAASVRVCEITDDVCRRVTRPRASPAAIG